jgi:hypothetical protein
MSVFQKLVSAAFSRARLRARDANGCSASHGSARGDPDMKRSMKLASSMAVAGTDFTSESRGAHAALTTSLTTGRRAAALEMPPKFHTFSNTPRSTRQSTPRGSRLRDRSWRVLHGRVIG